MLRHRLDHVQHATDLVAFALQIVHGDSGVAHFFSQTTNLLHGLGHHFIALLRFAAGVDCCFGSFFSVAGDFLHRSGHFVHGRGHLIGFHLLTINARTGLLSHRRQLLGSTGDLHYTVTDTANQIT